MSRSKIQLDIQTIHADDIGAVVGTFYGTPIRAWNANASQIREDADLLRRIAFAKEAENAIPVSQ